MSYNPNNPNGQASPANSAPVVLDTTDSGYLQSMNTAIASILANQTNGSQEVVVTNFPSIQAVSQSGTWSVGRTWNLTSGADSVTAAQGGTWNITNITGTISLPTGAATAANQATGNTSLASILAALTNGTQETQVTNFPSVQAVSQSGSWTVSLTSESIEIGKVDQGNAGSNAQAWWTQIGDGTHGPVAVKAASTAAAAADPSLVVALSPNSPLPAGSSVIGAVTQSGTWTTARSWNLTSGADSVTAAQGGTWNITNISGTVSLPTGASTSALQTSGNSTLSSILANQTNGTQETQVTNFPSVQAVSQSGTWNITNITGTVSLPTGAATSALQTTGNTSLASILANQTNGTQETQVTNFPSVQAVSQSGTWTTGRTWNLTSGADSVSAAQGTAAALTGKWPVQITDGTNTMPTMDVAARSGFMRITDGTNTAAVKAASTAAAAADPSVVVALSPNSPLPTGSNTIGATASESATGAAVPAKASAIGGSDGTNLQPIGATLKGNQGTYAISTQDLKDSGRTYVVITLDRTTGVTSEALTTMTINKGGTVTTGSSYTVTTGKTLRLQSINANLQTTTTTLAFGRIRVRSAGTVSASSGIICNLDIGAEVGAGGAANVYTAGQGVSVEQAIPEGLEIAAGQQVGISQIINSTSSTISVSLIGYEY